MVVFDVLMRLILQNIICGVEEWGNSKWVGYGMVTTSKKKKKILC